MPKPAPTPPADSARLRWLLDASPYLFLFVLALVIRSWGLGFAPTAPRARPDEELFIVPALKLFGRDKNPHFGANGWPELFFFAHYYLIRAYAWTLQLRYGTEPNLGCVYAMYPIRITVLARMLSALAGSLTVVVTAAFSARLVPTKLGGTARRAACLAGGLFLCLDYQHVRDSHYGVSDPTLVLFLTLALWFLAKIGDVGRLRHYALAGAMVGLAISTKWTALGFLPVVAVGLGWRWLVAPRARWHFWLGVALGTACLAAAFFATSPHVLEEPQPYIDGILSHKHRYEEGSVAAYNWNPHFEPVRGWIFHLFVTLPTSVGWPLVVFGALGTVLTAFTRRGAGVVGAAHTLLFYFVILGPSIAVFMRYSLPLHPTFCALAGFAVVWTGYHTLRWLRASDLWIGVVLAAVSLLLVVEPAIRSAQWTAMISRADTRDQATAWFNQHLGEHQTMLTRGGYTQVHSLEESGLVACRAVLPPELASPFPPRHVDVGTDYASLVARGAEGYGAVAEAAIGRYVQSHSFMSADYVVEGRPLLPCGELGRSDGWETPPACFTQVTTIDGGTPGCDTVFDTFDSSFVAVDRFEGHVVRTGPALTIWRNDCRTPAPVSP